MDVFAYGTLTERETAEAVLDEYEYRGAATLVGLHRVDGRYPTLAPGGTTEGRLLRTPDADALDEYEGVGRGLYVRVSLPTPETDAGETVDCYVGDPERLGVAVDWPGEGAFPERVREYCRDHEVLVSADE